MKTYKMEQRTPEWFAIKKGKIGGTRLKEVFAKNNFPLIYKLLAEEGLDELEPTFTSQAMQWGVDIEPFALAEYEQHTKQKMITDGWWEYDFSEIVGLSPDSSTEDYTHAAEFKCPNTSTHVEYIIGNRIPAAYKAQVLMYFIVNEKLVSLDFVSFDPRYLKRPMWIKTVLREELETELIEAKEKLMKFLEKLNEYRIKLNN